MSNTLVGVYGASGFIPCWQEIQKGYLLEDRLLRPAVVKVSKKPPKKNESKNGDVEDHYVKAI